MTTNRHCGIYSITNITNGKKYIGQSVNIKKRFNIHKHELRKGTHINKHLQSSWNKYGQKNFKFEILKECSEKELDEWEIFYISSNDSTDPNYGYNHEHGGTKNKKTSLISKLKRRGKWSHGISSKTNQAYKFRNMNVELWNTVRNYTHRDYTSRELKLPVHDINENKDFEDFITLDYVEKKENENMVDYKKLINKYYRKDGENITGIPVVNKAERFSKEYKQEIRWDTTRKNRHLILDELVAEVPFHLTKTQIAQIRYWIDSFNKEFKNFHRRSSNETIILALIFIQRKEFDNKTRVEDYSICSKYNLTEAVFLTIQNRLIFNLMNTIQLKYTQAKYVNHDILIKEGK